MLAKHLQTEIKLPDGVRNAIRELVFENKNKPIMNKLKFTLLSILLLLGMTNLRAQTVQVTPAVICKGTQTNIKCVYTPPAGKTVSSYIFDLYGDGNPSTTLTQNSSQPTAGYLYPPGVFTVKVSVKLSDGSTTAAVSSGITVYNLPVINMSVTTQDTQCFRGNYFCFKNLAVKNPLSPSNPLKTYYWNYGDAAGDTLYDLSDACHTYHTPIAVPTGFSVLLSVTDDHGCRNDSLFNNIVVLKPNIAPNFKWTFLTGPCFVTCYQFKNTGVASANQIQTYIWDFGDGSSFTGSGINDPQDHFDTLIHCYRKDGQFNPALTLTDITGCIDSTRKKSNNSVQALPQNINFQFDIIATKNATDTVVIKDTVCSGSGNAKTICYRMTPVSFASGGSGDFVWNFGDPNDPNNKNLDSASWNPCHLYSGMGTFFPSISIKNVCPDTTFIYHSVLETYSRMDSAGFPDNDWGPNPTPPPGGQVLPYKFADPLDFQDSITLYYTHTTRILPQLKEAPTNDTIIYAFTTKAKDKVIFFRKLAPVINVITPDTFILDSVRIPQTHIINFSNVPGGVKPLYHKYNPATGLYDSIYAYTIDFRRPTVLFKKSALITDTATGNNILSNAYIYYKLINSFKIASYGVEVIGPAAGIEAPPVPVVIKASQKNQCGPTDTVDFVNTSASFKSRKIWRRWDFDDNYAPQCTSFSVPRRGFPQPPLLPGQWGSGPWITAIGQDFGSDHYFVANGVTYPGRMSCKFSFDTLPRYSYPNWDTVYNWFRKGHDFMPWDPTRWDTVFPPAAGKFYVQPNDKIWWGKPIYLNIATGAWSLVPGKSIMQHIIKYYTYVDPISGKSSTRYYVDTIPTSRVPSNVDTVPWPRIDTMALRTNNGADLNPGSRILITNVPDPIGLARGKYVILNGPQMDTVQPNLQINYKGDSWNISPTTPIPGGGDFYEYVFRRTVQRCLTVKQRLRDTVNNESYVPGGPKDSLVLDDNDCFDEATVQLALGKADARGLAIGGKLCPGLSSNSFGANVKFSFSAFGIYPGLVPACGQTFVLFNYDSLADRKDQTPCTLDGFVTWQGGLTPGGLNRPPFFTGADFAPPTIWTGPGGTTFIYHYGFNSGTPPPADTANGWITVGLQIGNGCKDTSRKNILISQYRANKAIYEGAVGTFNFNRVFNLRPLTPGIPDTLVDIEYVDCNQPRCVSTPVWYHNFLRIINLDAVFYEFPEQNPASAVYTINPPVPPATPTLLNYPAWKLRGKGDIITVFAEDSIQDSVKYDSWMWGDATATVDSFWYSGDDTTDGFYTHGIRRVRYNLDILDPSNIIIVDSTVWPVRASYPGATDGLKPRSVGHFKYVSYDTLDYCTGLGKANPSYIIVDTAMMLMPITHKYARSSWEADNRIVPYKGPDANISSMVHFIVSTAGCQQIASKLVTIGIIDTFDTKNADGHSDSVFCVKEPVFFFDSVRYWRWDSQVSSLPFFPDQTNNPVQGNLTYGYPENIMQIDTFNFWRYWEFYPLDFRGSFYDDAVWRYNSTTGKIDTLIRHDSVVTERIYWDFGDGTFPLYMGRNPVHRYEGYGRYKVSMYSRDSLGFWDTCVRYVNIVKPVARIGLVQSIYNCGVPAVPMWDSSYMVFGTGPTTTDSVHWQYWWFGDNKLDTINPFTPATGNPNPQYPYRSNGKFTVKLVVETFEGCFDTATRDVFIKGPRPYFRLISDTIGCSPFRVTLVNMADSFDMQTPGDTPTRQTTIFWGDNSSDLVFGRRDTISHLYPDSGVFTISSIGSDADPITGISNCKAVAFPDTLSVRPIKIYLVKFPVVMNVSKHNICVNEVFQINNTSDSNYTKFLYTFYRGIDSLSSIDQDGKAPNTVDHSFDSAAVYTILGRPAGYGPNIPPATQKNCVNIDTLTVTVHKPYPGFDTDSTAYPLYKFTNNSTKAYYYTWSIFNSNGALRDSKNGNINDKDWNYDLKNDTGAFKVCLKAVTYDTLGLCPDSVCKWIYNNFVKKIRYPNVFSPNDDGVNDFFKVEVEGEVKFELKIFNRWGDKVFETVDAAKMWNGKAMNDGNDCAAGVYYFVLTWQYRGEAASHTDTGTITLIREN